MSPKESNKDARLYEYRIKYCAEPSNTKINNYHYFLALDPNKALDYHCFVISRNRPKALTISIEEKNPFNNKWEDKSEILLELK